MSRDMTPAEESLMEKLEETDCNVLNVNARGPKPVFSVTIEGSDVSPSVLEACRKFGYRRVLETEQVNWQDVDTATKILFEY